MDYNPLEEYGVIGNLETVALVSRDGGIDWCCLPAVDSPSLFARLLDSDRGGHFTIQPACSYDSIQRYVDNTNVLRTRFKTASGELTVTDFMPVPELDGVPLSTIYRQVTCESGRITLRTEYEPRFDYARTVPTVTATEHGIVAEGDDERAVLTSSIPLSVSEASASATTTLEAGETRWVILGHETEQELQPTAHRQTLDEVIEYWNGWVHECPDEEECAVGDPWHTFAVRSALALKLLTNWRTGGICAAPTTSLPEDIGGVRNWDYRFNWIRDAAFTVSAFSELGHLEEAEAYFGLCLEHCRGHDPADIQPLYGVRGGDVLAEEILDHLKGYRDSAPVRIGNAARHQQQLDVYGELTLAFYEAARHGVAVSEDDWEVIRGFVNYVCDAWDEPDYGIWEVRSEPRNFVYSKVMCWTALDRGIRIAEDTALEAPVDRWRTCRADVKEAIIERGYSESLDSFVRSFEAEDTLDSTGLLIPVVGFLPADDSRIQGTIDATLDRLTSNEGFVDRYEGDDGLPGDEGAFVLCSFWLVNALALSGRVDEATDVFQRILNHASPLGLFAEEIDPESGEQRGNFPQAFSHIGLINSAIYLTRAQESDGGMVAPLGFNSSDQLRSSIE